MSLTDDFLKRLREMITAVPPALLEPAMFDSFRYTTTGNNLCHSRTLGFLAKAAWLMPATAAVEIDVPLNLGTGIKFKPDIVVRDRKATERLIIDFEGPNNCDARIVDKDVGHYIRWVKERSDRVEYLIITSLPSRKRSASQWEVRHYRNVDHPKDLIRQNPLAYWYGYYRDKLNPEWRQFPIQFANFDGSKLEICTRMLLP
ncbi:MAG: hypothetical protein WA005_02855 [Candidatus Binataceae bacterium]